jgi:hypothetical protein
MGRHHGHAGTIGLEMTHSARINVGLMARAVLFHHQIVIHKWGWTLVLNPDGTTSAWNKDRTKVLHSHGPPARAG